MRKQEERHIIDILFVIGLFCIFALSTIFLISIGADIYGKTVSNTEINFNDRTSFAYVTEKIRQADRSKGRATRSAACPCFACRNIRGCSHVAISFKLVFG